MTVLAVRPGLDDPPVFAKLVALEAAAFLYIATSLEQTAQAIVLFVAAGTALGVAVRYVFRVLRKLNGAAENLDRLEHLPEWIEKTEAHVAAAAAGVAESRELARRNENALQALLRELGIEARALRRHTDFAQEAVEEAQRRRRRVGDPPLDDDTTAGPERPA